MIRQILLYKLRQIRISHKFRFIFFISQAPCTIAHSNISQPEYTYVELLRLQGFLDSESEPLSYVSE